MRTSRLVSPTCKAVPLTVGEFNLLTAFLRAPQQVLSREQLLAASRLTTKRSSTAASTCKSCRSAASSDPSVPKLLTTERGVGYTLAVPVSISLDEFALLFVAARLVLAVRALRLTKEARR